MGLSETRILVVGGGSGIGYAIAAGAIAEGAHVVIASTNIETVESAAKQLGPQASAARLDVYGGIYWAATGNGFTPN